MRVALVVPSGDEVKADFWISTYHLLTTPCPIAELMLLNPRTSLIENSRYIAVKMALERGADHVFFVDSDMTFPGDALARLLGHGRAVVGATYCRRREPYGVLGVGLEAIEPGATGLRRMARLPLGMTLIDAAIFREVAPPWFEARFLRDDGEWLSEDYAFCDAVRAVGHDVWCDLDLSHELGHVGQEIYTWGRTLSSSAAVIAGSDSLTSRVEPTGTG